MELDLELYRYSVQVSGDPKIRLSVIDVAPENPQRTFVLLHGMGGHALQWEYQFDALTDKNRVIALDMRGHGKSDTPRGGYEMGQILRDISDVLSRIGVPERFVLAGHSFGGAIAIEYALKQPEQLSHLILIATAGKYQLSWPQKTALSLPLFLHRLLDPYTRRLLHARPVAMKAWFENMLKPWRGWDLMAGIQTPTLVIRGNRDRVFPRASFEKVAQTIPGAEDVDVGAAGHMVQLERRDLVNRAILSFVGAGRRLWRDENGDEESERNRMLARRPWLANYEDEVPYTVAIPPVPLQQLLRSAVRRFPNHPAVIFEGRRTTYRALNHRSNRLANALLGLDLKPGDRVLLRLPNGPEMLVAFFGILKAGGIPVLSPESEPGELDRQIRNTEARILIGTGGEMSAMPAGLPKSVAHYILVQNAGHARNPVQGAHSFEGLLARHPRANPEVPVDPQGVAVIIFTGGTTAKARGVMLTHYNLVANAVQNRHWLKDSKAGEERFLCVLPNSHIYGLMTGLVLPVALAGTMIQMDGFDLQRVLNAIKKHRPTIFPGIPPMYMAIANHPGVRQFNVESIKACLSGSEPLPVEVQEQFEKLTRGRLVEGYGLTEASPVTHVNPFYGQRKVGSIGLPLPSTDARIVDLAQGEETVPARQIGELEVRGPQVMKGYWKDPQETARVLRPDGWLRTGDVAQMDEAGYFRIISRRSDMWYPDKNAEPAFPRDVEEVLYEIPQVKEAAIVAIAGQPIGFVVAKGSAPPAEELIAYCRRRLPPELVPRVILFVDEFPRTFIGKLIRRELAKRFEEKQGHR